MSNVKLSPPWVTYVNKIRALFEMDDEVQILYDEEAQHVKLYVNDARKAEALSRLLPTQKTFGNVTLAIEIVPANDEEKSRADLFREAFRGNEALASIESIETPFGSKTYIIFCKKVVQFYNDQMDDIHGNLSTLYQEIAKDVFEDHDGIFFCTEAPVRIGY